MALCAVAAVLLILRLLPHGRSGPPPVRKVHTANAYAGLRDLALQATRSNFGLGSGATPTQPFVVITDWGDPQGTTTIIAVADGSASVYRSDGSGSIGGGQAHEAVRAAAIKAVELAAAAQTSMQRATAYPPAERGQVSFYLITDAGVFTATVAQEDLTANRSPYTALAAATKEIETEYRRIERR